MNSIIERVKNGVLYVLGPFVALLVYILYLRNQNQTLKDQVSSARFDAHDEELKHVQDKTDGDAADALHNYERLRDSYLSGSNPGVRPSSSGETETGRDPRSTS